jgi:MFS family permease/quinol monooxygenase YgiN
LLRRNTQTTRRRSTLRRGRAPHRLAACDDAATMTLPVANPPAAPDASALAPLREPLFRMLWGVWITANVCMWMNDVAAAWLMTTLTTSPVMVALVQTASTLPVFLLGLPSGALADIVDRRRHFILTQVWVAVVGLITCMVVLAGAVSPALLIALTFANGIGLALRWPVFAALVPELVDKRQLSSALALNAIAMNVSRIGGPVIAGAVIAAAGSAYVFMLNALLSLAAALVLSRWRREAKLSTLPGERFLGAIRIGVQHVRQSRPMHTALLRISLFFLQAAALPALLPLLARGLKGGDAATFTLLLACMGVGAIGAALFLPRWRLAMSRDRLVSVCILVNAVATVAVSFAPNIYLAVPAMLVVGATWIAVANTITLAAQLCLPDWVRARGMSIYQMAMMGSSALGAALWGQVASVTQVHTSLVLSALAAVLCLALTRRRTLDGIVLEDLTPTQEIKSPQTALEIGPHDGPVIVTVEYRIDPANANAFLEVMQESRRHRLRQGVVSWDLFRDTADPGLYIEHFIDETWADHLRRFDRMTTADLGLRERRLAFHTGERPPVVTRRVAVELAQR